MNTFDVNKHANLVNNVDSKLAEINALVKEVYPNIELDDTLEKVLDKVEQDEVKYKPKTSSVKISTIRNSAYKKIDELCSEIKNDVDLSERMYFNLVDKVDISMKNTINKILNDFKTSLKLY